MMIRVMARRGRHARFHSPLYWLSGVWMLEGTFWVMLLAFAAAVWLTVEVAKLSVVLVLGVLAYFVDRGEPGAHRAIRSGS